MRTTWAQMIADLEAADWSLTGIGDKVGLSPQSISDIKQGRTVEPRGMAAVELHALHRREMAAQKRKAAEAAAPTSAAA